MSVEAEAERAFVGRFRAQFGADVSLLTSGGEVQDDQRGDKCSDSGYGRNAAVNDEEIDRLLPRFGGSNRRKRRPVASSGAALASTSLTRPPDVLRRFLWTLFRRFPGRLLVQGRLLNLEELLVTHFVRVDASDSASKDSRSDQQPCICIKEGSVRLVVRCVGAIAAQIGQDGVLARLVAQHDVDAQLFAAEDASERDDLPLDSARPVGVVMPPTECDVPWSSQQSLEEMSSVYGFDIDAFASSEVNVASEHSDDEELPLNALLMSTRLFHDLRGSDKMMEMFHVPSETFQSFAWATALKHRQQPSDRAVGKLEAPKGGNNEPNPWSYRELDSAQKRKWADERYEYGLELLGKRKLREAMAEFESALKLNDRHAGALAAKGRAHMTARQLQDAVDCLERAVEIDPLLATAQADLLRAKGILAHSRHVSNDSSYELNGARAEIDRAAAATRDRSSIERLDPRDTGRERARKEDSRSATSTTSAKSLEEERLRLLLEEEERRRRRSRQSRQRSRSDSAESDSSCGERGRSRERRRSSSKKRKREKKHRKEKRKHKKSDRKRKSKKDSGRYKSDYLSSDSRSSRSSDASRRSNRRRSPRGGSKSRADEDKTGDLPAILSRTKHRIWN